LRPGKLQIPRLRYAPLGMTDRRGRRTPEEPVQQEDSVQQEEVVQQEEPLQQEEAVQLEEAANR
jgi:hypothetical protein